jgi:hypothetical protein
MTNTKEVKKNELSYEKKPVVIYCYQDNRKVGEIYFGSWENYISDFGGEPDTECVEVQFGYALNDLDETDCEYEIENKHKHQWMYHKEEMERLIGRDGLREIQDQYLDYAE